MEEGLEQIVTTLRDHLHAQGRVELHTNKPCTNIEFEGSKTKVSGLFFVVVFVAVLFYIFLVLADTDLFFGGGGH